MTENWFNMKLKTDTAKSKSNPNRRTKAAVFLDRDGTIIEDRGHLRDPADVVFFPETFEVLRKLQEHFLLFIVTNQVGVAEGVITRTDVDRINHLIVTAMAERAITVTDVYVCPHGRSDNCLCIKPKPYFLKKASEHYGIDLSASFSIGDHPHDIELARNAGARGIYVLTGHGRKHRTEIPDGSEVVAGIKQAAEKILSSCQVNGAAKQHKRRKTKFVLDLGIACELWLRDDLGSEPVNASEVAKVLSEAGIKVYEVSGGWLECEPRPVGIFEALSGRPASPGWASQFNCPPEQRGDVLKLLTEKGIPVRNFAMTFNQRNLQAV